MLQSSRSQMFFKIGVLWNFAIFTVKHLCWSLFLIKLQAFTPFYTEHLRRLLLVLGVQQYEELSVVRWNIWCKPFLTLTYTPSAWSVTGFISQYLKYLKLHLFVFPMFMNFFQLIHVILKILNIANKSNYLLQQHYFNHFHFTWKCFFGIKIKQNFTNSIEDQRQWSVFLWICISQQYFRAMNYNYRSDISH